jgi:hypothetical protein
LAPRFLNLVSEVRFLPGALTPTVLEFSTPLTGSGRANDLFVRDDGRIVVTGDRNGDVVTARLQA